MKKKEFNALDKIEDIPSLPADFQEWCFEQFDGWYCQYVGSSVLDGEYTQFCSHCGEEKVLSKEDRTQLKNVKLCTCQNCGATGPKFYANRKKRATFAYQTVWLGQKWRDTYLLRGFRIELGMTTPSNPSICFWEHEQNWEIGIYEKRRMFILEDGVATRYCGTWPGDSCYGVDCSDRWDRAGADQANCGGPVYPTSFDELEGTPAEYSMFEQEINKLYETNESAMQSWGKQTYGGGWYGYDLVTTAWDYMYAFGHNRRLEMLIKMGFEDYAEEIVKNRGKNIIRGQRMNYRAKKPFDYFGIYKNRMKDLREYPEELELFRWERKAGAHLTEEEVSSIQKLRLSAKNMEVASRYGITPRKYINYIEKASKSGLVGNISDTYEDYLRMRDELGYDMTDSIILFPKKLKEMHDRMVVERVRKESDARKAEVNIKFKGIQKKFKNLLKVYSYCSGNYIIRPAKDAAEIVEEGRILHHCVGGDNYLAKHSGGKSIILFLREKTKPDIPLITIEIEGYEIKQWYGAYDKKPDKKKYDRYLKRYTNKLKKGAAS